MIKLKDITKQFPAEDGGSEVVLKDVSFSVNDGEFVSLIGPSGCGKTTLLNIIAGLIEPDSGTIIRDERIVSPDELPCSYVFQEPRLLDWATVEENIAFALDAKEIPAKEHDSLIETYLQKVNLTGENNSYPLNLSGGMQQRVGIARALAVEEDIILMDEPFSSLDEITARQLRDDVLDIWRDESKTVIFVTHNIREAIYMSDKILLMLPKRGITHRAEVELSRPRQMEDPRVLELEQSLMGKMAGEKL